MQQTIIKEKLLYTNPLRDVTQCSIDAWDVLQCSKLLAKGALHQLSR